jgi:hypothetical protein
MDDGTWGAREVEVASWRDEILRMVWAGERLSTIEDRLDNAGLRETERLLLRLIARGQVEHSDSVERYWESFRDTDG